MLHSTCIAWMDEMVAVRPIYVYEYFYHTCVADQILVVIVHSVTDVDQDF